MREACFEWFKVKLNSKPQFSNCTLQFMTMWMKQYWLDTKTCYLCTVFELCMKWGELVRPLLQNGKNNTYINVFTWIETNTKGTLKKVTGKRTGILILVSVLVERLGTVSTNIMFSQYTAHTQLLNTTHYPTVFTPIILCYGIYNNPAFSTSSSGAIFLIWSLQWQSHLT
jgi:hypothetical protein